jgi:hypothetical protein
VNPSTPGLQTLPFGFYDVNANVRVYVSRAELTTLPIETLHRHETTNTKLFADVLITPGIAAIVGQPYQMVVEKAELWSWDEIHPRVMDHLIAANIVAMPPMTERKQ